MARRQGSIWYRTLAQEYDIPRPWESAFVGDSFGQREFRVRMDWGLTGAQEVCEGADFAVIVDVLSFTTTLSVALDCGVEVFPYAWQDATAQDFARRHDAVLAVGRAAAAPADGGKPLISLSPASIRAAAGLRRIVLPSPNGSALASHLTSSGGTVLGACLRNRSAVARWLMTQRLSARPRKEAGRPVVAIVAAGERWPDGTLRPAAEDLWGAGAVIAALASLGVTGLSPEARSAAGAWHAVEATLDTALTICSSGRELTSAGYAADVEIAAELDASSSVPLLSGGRFADAAGDRVSGI
jgi:2-phosphosulfolactate phosphatase